MSGESLKFEQLSSATHRDWDELCLKSQDAWFLHTTAWQKYEQLRIPQLKAQNLSFFVVDANGTRVAICPLFVEENSGVREFSYGGSHLPIPALAADLGAKHRGEILAAILARIDELAAEYRVARCSMRLSPLCQPEQNPLVRFGYLDVSLHSQVIETSQSLEELQREVRKGHLSDIKRGLKLMDLTVYDRESITPELFAAYQQLQAKAAGRVTRPQATFDLMHAMIRDGRAALVAARADGRFVGFSLVLVYKNRAYYSSAANEPDAPYDRYPVAHAIQWKTIEWLHARGCALYEIGWQHFGPQLHDLPSAKLMNLSRFKRGFGGRTVPLYCGEKYYDAAFCEQVLGGRAAAYVKALRAAPRPEA